MVGFWELRPGVGGGDGVPGVAFRGVVGAVGHDVAEEVEDGVEPVGAGRPGNGGAEGTSCGGVRIPPMISVRIFREPLLDAPLLLVSLVNTSLWHRATLPVIFNCLFLWFFYFFIFWDELA